MAIVCVIDPSASVRETLRIVLGHEHEVVVAAAADGLAIPTTADVVVLGLPAEPRDERAIGAALARAVPAAPVLLLESADDVALERLLPPQRPVEFLRKPFDAYALRAKVRALLKARRAADVSTQDAARERRHLEYPFLAPAAAHVVRRALAADVPVLLRGEPGTGAPDVAHALHVLRGVAGPFTMVDAAALAPAAAAERWTAARRGTLFVANLDRAPADVQHALLLGLRGGDGDAARLVASAQADLGELAAAGAFSPELAYAVTTLPVVLPPLRERRDDLPELVAMLTAEIADRVGLASVRCSDAALARLGDYLWFGNVAELTAVLTRTIALHRPSVIEADDLVFLPEATAAASARRTDAARAGAAVARVDGAPSLNLEVVLGELAHELRNPMVTIKTFAQHLDSVLGDPESRQRFSALTTEAIGRMDGLLETLLDFSRFRAPALQPTDLRALVDRALDEQAEELARRHVDVQRNGAPVGTVEADEAQVAFALRSLFRGLVADLTPHSPLAIRGVEPGVLELQVRTEPSTAARLAAWVEPHAGGASETPPLAWALAATLVHRNGGVLSVRAGDQNTTVIRVEWPSASR